MVWFSILKMPNPYGGRWPTLTKDEYYKMDNENKENYHESMRSHYRRKIERAVQAPPLQDDKIRELRELERFHYRQLLRMKRNSTKEIYYSLEDEQNRFMMKPQYDAVERIPDTTKEMYDNYSRDEKHKYWARLHHKFITEDGRSPESHMAFRMYMRMKHNPNYTPPFEGDETTVNEYKDLQHRDISEYDNFTDEEKRKYHSRMMTRGSRKGVDRRYSSSDASKFHGKMRSRLATGKSGFPTYPTLEAEKEAEQ